VPVAHAFAFSEALEPLVDSCSIFEIEGSDYWAVAGITQHFPDHASLVKAIKQTARDAEIDPPDVEILQLPNIDWLAQNRDSFPSLRYGRFLIHGSHERPARPTHALTIEVDAGRAFGSGTHGSTEGCLRSLDRLSRSIRPKRMLDLGCGSGILAMAAARLWRRVSVLAVDIDIHAVRTTAENTKRNHVARQIHAARADGYPRRRHGIGGNCDLVTANILAAPLISMATDAKHWLRPGGRIILSGLLRHQERAVQAAYGSRGFILLRRVRIQGWSTLSLRLGGRLQPSNSFGKRSNSVEKSFMP
jgi:ribosomal protein L11 methyltransferase